MMPRTVHAIIIEDSPEEAVLMESLMKGIVHVNIIGSVGSTEEGSYEDIQLQSDIAISNSEI